MGAVVIIQGHPSISRSTYAEALAEAYASGVRSKGREAQIVRIADLDLPYIRNQAEWTMPGDGRDITAIQKSIGACEHLVFIYSLWLGDVPAKLKSFLEHISRAGFMTSLDGGRHWRRRMSGKTARVIVTMGMPAIVYRCYFLAHSVRSLKRNVLTFSGVKPVKSTIIGSVEVNVAHRRKWLSRVEKLGERGV